MVGPTAKVVGVVLSQRSMEGHLSHMPKMANFWGFSRASAAYFILGC